MLLGFTKKILTINEEQLFSKIKEFDWTNAKQIYNLELPYPALERLEFIQKRLEFERKTEGRVVSPPWYITMLISQALAFGADTQLKVLFVLLKDHFVHKAEMLIQKKQFILAIQIVSRGLEYTNKLSFFLGDIQKTTDLFSRYKLAKTLPWPAIDWSSFQKEITERNDELLILLSQCIPNYPRKKFSEDFPDYFGQAVHISGEVLYTSMVSNNQLLFEKVFPNYFHGIIEIHDRLLARDPFWNLRDQLTAFSEPLLDLIYLSGYAYIYSEYHQNPYFWKACKDLWDHFLNSVDTRKTLSQLAGEIYHSKYLFAITPRSLTRTNWEIRLRQSLEKFPRKAKWTYSIHAHQILDHPSRLIRVLGGTDNFMLSLHHVEDVFIDLYLKSFPDFVGLDFGNRDDINDTLKMWQENEESEEESEEDVNS